MQRIKRIIISVLLILCLVSASALVVEPIHGLPDSFIRGVDISMLDQIEKNGGKYYDASGTEKDLLVILKENGVNWIRLRLWNNPVDASGAPLGGGNNSLESTLRIASRAKKLGFKFLLDFHYSDFWADPAHQKKPAVWKDLDLDGLNKEIYSYTSDVLKAFVAANAAPDMVQIGNEVNGGMLWPEGKIWKETPSDVIGGYEGFISLLKQAARAVRDYDPQKNTEARIRIAIHLANGGDNALYRNVFDAITGAKVDFDIIGLSWYPYWHGPLSDLAANLADLSVRYGKELVILETAYAYTMEDGDAQGNLFQLDTNPSGWYKPTVQGQTSLLRDLMATVSRVPGGKGLGIFYWEPDWIPVKGVGAKAGEGDSWENQALFDFKGKELPSLSVFKKIYSTDIVSPAVPVGADVPDLSATVGDKFSLPISVLATFSDDSVRPVPVVWEAFEPRDYQKEGTVSVRGRLRDADIAVKVNIRISSVRNLFPDPSFENGTLEGWILDGSSKACFAESNAANAHTGRWTYKYWLDQPFHSVLSYTFTDIPNGTYCASCWAAGGGGDKALALAANGFGGDKPLSVPIVNSGWQKWHEYKIEGIQVTNNRCTISITIDAMSGDWGNFDDVSFYQIP